MEEEVAVFLLGAGSLMMDSGSPQIYDAVGPAAMVVKGVDGVGGALTQGNSPCLLPSVCLRSWAPLPPSPQAPPLPSPQAPLPCLPLSPRVPMPQPLSPSPRAPTLQPPLQSICLCICDAFVNLGQYHATVSVSTVPTVQICSKDARASARDWLEGSMNVNCEQKRLSAEFYAHATQSGELLSNTMVASNIENDASLA